MELRAPGCSQYAIAEYLYIQRKTVRHWLRSDGFPEQRKPRRAPVRFEEDPQQLQQRWNAGVTAPPQHSSRSFDAAAQGSGRSMVARYVSR